MQHLLGVANRGVRGRHQHQHRGSGQRDAPSASRTADGAGQVLRQAGQRRIDPERLFARRHQQDEQERPECRRDERRTATVSRPVRRSACTRGAANSWAARASASPPPTTGSARAKPSRSASAASSGSHAGDRGDRREARDERTAADASARERDRRPRRWSSSEDRRRRSRRPRQRVAADVAAEPSSAATARPIDADRDQRREILGPDEAGEAPPGDGRWPTRGHVVPDHDTGERAEQHALDQRRRLRESGGARARTRCATRLTNPPGMSSAQLSMSIARTNAASTVGREHEPRRRLTERRARDAGNEERRDAQLRDRQRGGLPHRHERQQRRRRQDDADRVTGRNG